MFGTFANEAERLAHPCGPFDRDQVWKQADTRELYRIVRQGTGAQCWELQYEDEGDTSSLTEEEVQDIVGAMVTNSSHIFWTYQDALNALSAAIVAGSVTFSRIQNIATDRLLGRDTAGTGSIEEISLAGGLEFTGSQSVQRSALTGDVTASAGSGTTVVESVAADLQLLGVSSPSQITSDQNDYAISATVTRARISSDAARSITGIASGADGRLLAVHNVGSFPITLVTESASSTAANRFAFPADIVIPAAGSAVLLYDSTSSRWRVVESMPAQHQTLDASTSTVTYNVQRGLHASVTLSSGVSATFDVDFTNLVAGMRGTLVVTTSGTVDLNNIEVSGVQGAFTESGAAPSSFLNDNETAILEWFYNGNLYVWRTAATLINYAA